VAVFSYDGELAFGVTADADTADDVDVLAQGIRAELDDLLAHAPAATPPAAGAPAAGVSPAAAVPTIGAVSTPKLYHNPRCSKSRAAKDLLGERGVEVEVVEYLKTPPSRAELEAIVAGLDGDPQELVRTKDPKFKALGVDPAGLTDAQAVGDLLVEHREVMERPVLCVDGRAAIGRPLERIEALLGWRPGAPVPTAVQPRAPGRRRWAQAPLAPAASRSAASSTSTRSTTGSAWPSTSRSGRMRSSHRGSHQLRSPSSSMVAGTSSIRTMVASSRIAAARPVPISFITRSFSRMKLPNTNTMIAAAAVMTLAVAARPSATEV